jgi:F-type H+-transporting ATPase subunit b
MHESHLLEYIFESNIINFLIVFSFIVYLMVKFNLVGVIENKKNQIIKAIEDSKAKVETSKAELAESKNKVKNIDTEKNQIINEAQKVAKTLSEQIEEDALKKKEAIELKSEKTIEGEKQKAIKDVSIKVADAAFEVAKQHIIQSLDNKKQLELIDEFINNLEEIKV